MLPNRDLKNRKIYIVRKINLTWWFIMNIAITKMSSKGQIVIPSEMRNKLNEGEKMIIIQSGDQFIMKKISKLTKNYPDYYLSKYVGKNDIGWVLSKSLLIINRSGANYCQEIVALGKKSILIPLPFSQQNEQLKNALWVKHKLPHLTTIIEQKDLTPNKLYRTINRLSRLKTTNHQAKPVQNNHILALINKYV